MAVWVKICGNTNLADCESAVNAGADALGFIFAESSRRVSAERAGEMIQALTGSVEKIGVFVNETEETVAQTTFAAGLTGVQLHGDEPPAYVERLKRGLPGIKIIKALHAGNCVLNGLGYFAGGEYLVNAIMVDSGSAAMRGGTGHAFDWVRLHHFITGVQERTRVIVAGGLDPENVAACIAMFSPYGVDAVSGVECAKGKKDHAKLRNFIRAARGNPPK